jgi:hypothetical protein
MRNSSISGLLFVLSLSISVQASATDYCADIISGFADAENELAKSYDRMSADHKTLQEVCNFTRDTAIPTRKRILAKIIENQSRCDFGGAEIKFAQENVRRTISDFQRDCGAAGN